MPLDHRVHKSQTTTFRAHAARTDAGKITILVKHLRPELRHYTAVLDTPVVQNSLMDDTFLFGHVRQSEMPRVTRFHVLRQREQSAAVQPTRHIVVRHMIQERLVRDVEHLVLQLLQILARHHHLAGLGVAETEITEAKTFGYLRPQVQQQRLTLFVQEHSVGFMGQTFVIAVRRLYDDWNKRVRQANVAQQPSAPF